MSEFVENSDTAHGVQWKQCWQGCRYFLLRYHKIVENFQRNVFVNTMQVLALKQAENKQTHLSVTTQNKSGLIIGWPDFKEVNVTGITGQDFI